MRQLIITQSLCILTLGRFRVQAFPQLVITKSFVSFLLCWLPPIGEIKLIKLNVKNLANFIRNHNCDQGRSQGFQSGGGYWKGRTVPLPVASRLTVTNNANATDKLM